MKTTTIECREDALQAARRASHAEQRPVYVYGLWDCYLVTSTLMPTAERCCELAATYEPGRFCSCPFEPRGICSFCEEMEEFCDRQMARLIAAGMVTP